MNLEDVTVELRPRSEWEGAELGVRMVRRDAAAIYATWFAVTLPFLLLASAMIWFRWLPAFALLVYWWFEPVADGPVLRIISRRLFGETADWRAAWRASPAIAWQNRLFLLTPYRLHFARSIALPVTQLEGQRGAARRARARTLNQRIMNHGTGLTVAYQHLVSSLYLGAIILTFALVPGQLQQGDALEQLLDFWAGNDRRTQLANLLIFYAAQSALQPWFVGAGFGLYINCRTQLEAWDIEVAFRRIVQRRAAAMAATAACALLLFVPFAPSATAHAQEEPAADDAAIAGDPGFAGFWETDEVAQALTTVLDSEALADVTEVSTWQPLAANDDAARESAGGLAWFFAALGRFFSVIFEFGGWLLLAALVLLVFATRDRWWPMLQRPAGRAVDRPGLRLAIGEVTAESLPDDIPAAVRRLWAAGDHREALGLLYRGSVYAAVQRHGVRLPASATEGACIAAVSAQTGAGQSAYFRRVVNAWSALAYGAIDPGAAVVEPLCDEWPQHYGSAA